MKAILLIASLLIFQAEACEDNCIQKPSPIDCGEEMDRYSKVVAAYAESVEKTEISQLVKFKNWLEENQTVQLTCNAYNQNKAYEPHYGAIFNASIDLISSIKFLAQSIEEDGRPEKVFIAQVKNGYLLMQSSTKIFNKSL